MASACMAWRMDDCGALWDELVSFFCRRAAFKEAPGWQAGSGGGWASRRRGFQRLAAGTGSTESLEQAVEDSSGGEGG